MNRINEVADQRVVMAATDRFFPGEKMIKVAIETAKSTPDTATPDNAFLKPKPPLKLTANHITAASTVAENCAKANF
ncbi:MAG: hypothetical protein QF718_01020 [Phycisphaerales bacterium]|nr:hypothetical protein [Phycisphaerales bacterium]